MCVYLPTTRWCSRAAAPASQHLAGAVGCDRGECQRDVWHRAGTGANRDGRVDGVRRRWLILTPNPTSHN